MGGPVLCVCTCRSEDFGLTLSKTSAPWGNWTAVACSSDGEKLLAANDQLHLYSSTNGGAYWRKESAAGQSHWGSVALSASGGLGLASDRTGDRVVASWGSITAAPTPAPTSSLDTLSDGGGKKASKKGGTDGSAVAGAAVSAIIGVGVVGFAGYMVMKTRASRVSAGG